MTETFYILDIGETLDEYSCIGQKIYYHDLKIIHSVGDIKKYFMVKLTDIYQKRPLYSPKRMTKFYVNNRVAKYNVNSTYLKINEISNKPLNKYNCIEMNYATNGGMHSSYSILIFETNPFDSMINLTISTLKDRLISYTPEYRFIMYDMCHKEYEIYDYFEVAYKHYYYQVQQFDKGQMSSTEELVYLPSLTNITLDNSSKLVNALHIKSINKETSDLYFDIFIAVETLVNLCTVIDITILPCYPKYLVRQFLNTCGNELICHACNPLRLFNWNEDSIQDFPEEYKKECLKYS